MALIFFYLQAIIFILCTYFISCGETLKELKLGVFLQDSSKYDKYYFLKIPENFNKNQDLVFDIFSTDKDKNTDPDIYISTVCLIYLLLFVRNMKIPALKTPNGPLKYLGKTLLLSQGKISHQEQHSILEFYAMDVTINSSLEQKQKLKYSLLPFTGFISTL